MAEIKIISESKLRFLAGEKGFNLIYTEKDYFLTLLLYLLKDVKGLCFKGGTALNKIFLKHTRLSEDLDFSCKRSLQDIKQQVVEILKANKELFPAYVFEKETNSFFRLKIFYKSFFLKTSHVILDVNKKASVILPAHKEKLPHFYEGIPRFKITVINIDELAAEKVRAMITRNQPRDYFDVYSLLKKGYKINMDLVNKKLADVNQKFSVERIFKNAQKIYSRWDVEITQLTNKPVGFMTVMRRLQKEFGYKPQTGSLKIRRERLP